MEGVEREAPERVGRGHLGKGSNATLKNLGFSPNWQAATERIQWITLIFKIIDLGV